MKRDSAKGPPKIILCGPRNLSWETPLRMMMKSTKIVAKANKTPGSESMFDSDARGSLHEW
jgi:hypothetical protein